jgi:hypothetical protein
MARELHWLEMQSNRWWYFQMYLTVVRYVSCSKSQCDAIDEFDTREYGADASATPTNKH